MPRTVGNCAQASIVIRADLDGDCSVLYNWHMSADSKYLINYLCYYEPMDKIWGWLQPDVPAPVYQDRRSYSSASYRGPKKAYAFWGVIGKTVSIKEHHIHNKGNMHPFELRKIANKYEVMTPEALLERWPLFWEQLEQAIIFHKLSEG